MNAALRTVVIIAVVFAASHALIGSALSGRLIGFGYRFESRALDLQKAAGEKAFETAVTADLKANGSDATIVAPAPLPTANVCASGTACNYTGSTSYKITGQPTRSLANGNAGTSGDDEAYNLERQPVIAQNTLSVELTSTVWNRNGAAASQCELKTYRIMSAQPWLDPVGTSNCAANVGMSLERDSGGCDPQSVATCDVSNQTQEAPSSTLQPAILTCEGAKCGTATPRPASTYLDNQWQDGNESTGWSTH